MEVLRILGVSLAAAGLAIGVSMLVGVTLLELPYSLPFSASIAVILVLLGILIVLNMALSWRAASNAAAAAAAAAASASAASMGGVSSTGVREPAVGGAVGSAANSCVLGLEIAVLTLMGLLTVAGGTFSLLIYFYALMLPPWARLTMYVILGASVTTIVSINILDLVEMILRACAMRRVGALTVPPKVGRRLLPMRAQVWLILFIAVATGVYYGYVYGTIIVRILTVVDVSTRYNPWPKVVQYLPVTLPVAGTTAFFGVLVALVLPHLCGSPPAPKKSDEAPLSASPAVKNWS